MDQQHVNYNITVQSTLLSPFILHRWHLSQSLGCVFISDKRRFLGVIWSGFPTHLLLSFLLTQWSRTQAICQGVKLCLAARNIYPNIYISYYCLYIPSVDLSICYLFFGKPFTFPIFSHSREGKTRTAISISVCIIGKSWINKIPINSLLIL